MSKKQCDADITKSGETSVPPHQKLSSSSPRKFVRTPTIPTIQGYLPAGNTSCRPVHDARLHGRAEQLRRVVHERRGDVRKGHRRARRGSKRSRVCVPRRRAERRCSSTWSTRGRTHRDARRRARASARRRVRRRRVRRRRPRGCRVRGSVSGTRPRARGATVAASADPKNVLWKRKSTTREARVHFRAARAEVKRRVVFARRAYTPLAAVAIFACHARVCCVV